VAIATRFAAKGTAIVGGYWHGERLGATVAAIQATGGKILSVQGNIAEQVAAERLIDQVYSLCD